MAEIAYFLVQLHRHRKSRLSRKHRLSLHLGAAYTIGSDGDHAGEWEEDQNPAYAKMLEEQDPKEQRRVEAIAKAMTRLLLCLDEDVNTCASPKAGTPGAQFCSPDDRCPECELRESLRG